MNKTKHRIAGALLLAAIFVVISIVGFWRPGLLRGRPNAGHQLGGDFMKDLSGNTIECFARGVELHESDSGWHYSECDIRETKDNRLVVFHDWDISCVPNSVENQSSIGGPVDDQAICDLTLAQIQGLTLNCGCKIPTLEEVLEKARELNLTKPLLLEFKYLHSQTGRERMLRLATQYRDLHGIEIHFLSFVRNVGRSFPDSKTWLKKFSDSKFRVYQVYRPKTEEYDLCKTWN